MGAANLGVVSQENSVSVVVPQGGGAVINLYVPSPGGFPLGVPEPSSGVPLGVVPNPALSVDVPPGSGFSLGGSQPFNVTFSQGFLLNMELPAGSIGDSGPFKVPKECEADAVVLRFPNGGTLTMDAPNRRPNRGTRVGVKIAGSGIELLTRRAITK